MILNAKFVSLRRSPRDGFSLVELVLSLAVLLIITTLAIPVVVRSLQSAGNWQGVQLIRSAG
jgi:prepilin-type N-terminal cleavage/methylation domain-containing protein